MSAAAEIRLNGEGRSLPPGTSVEALVRDLGRDPRTVAVEYNGRILRRDRYASTELVSGDNLEIVHFVQGG